MKRSLSDYLFGQSPAKHVWLIDCPCRCQYNPMKLFSPLFSWDFEHYSISYTPSRRKVVIHFIFGNHAKFVKIFKPKIISARENNANKRNLHCPKNNLNLRRQAFKIEPEPHEVAAKRYMSCTKTETFCCIRIILRTGSFLCGDSDYVGDRVGQRTDPSLPRTQIFYKSFKQD